MSRAVHAAFALIGATLPGCIAPSVVASSGRAVAQSHDELAWSPATAREVEGFFESVSVTGAAAGALGRVYYFFEPGGSYTGAALLLGGAQAEFQTLSGTWTLDGGVLDLGDGQTARVFAAEAHLKLESPEGALVLKRTAVH